MEKTVRIIKFRQWIPQQKRMSYAGMEPGCWKGFEYVTWGKYPVMQFTGLLDRNGKEIWESDFLEIYDWSIHNPRLVGISKVIWDKEQAGWRIEPDLGIEDWYDLISKAIPCSKIIGNIYENPDLLEAKQ